jgi:hypothetical protein
MKKKESEEAFGAFGEKRDTYRILVWKPDEGNTYRSRWDNTSDIEMNIKEIVRDGSKWLYVAQLTASLWAAVNKLMDLRGPLKELNILASCGSVSF